MDKQNCIQRITSAVRELGGRVETAFKFPQHIVELDARGELTVAEIFIEDGVLKFFCEEYLQQSVVTADEMAPEALGRISDYFASKDFERLLVRENISRLLADSDERHPVECPVSIRIESAFQVPGDGTIWVKVESEEEPVDIEEFPTATLQTILKTLTK